MYECFREYFIYNDEVRKRENFDNSVLVEGKSLYEVIRVIKGAPLFLKDHIDRLKNSSKLTNLSLGLNDKEIEKKIFKLIEINNVKEGNVKLVFNYKYIGDKVKNNFVAYFLKHKYPLKDQYEVGVPTIFYHGERENPNAKVINVDFRKEVNKKIEKAGVFEAILVDRKGYITEGSRSNIFMIKGEKVVTSPVEDVLPGITRDRIIDVCKSLNFKVEEKRINYKEIEDLDGLFISGTSPKVLPINKVDNILFKSSSNKVIMKIMQGYNQAIEKDIENRLNVNI